MASELNVGGLVTTTAVVGSNTAGGQVVKINGNGDSGDGAALAFQTAGTTKSQIGRQSGIIGAASSDNLALFAAASLGVNVYTGGNTSPRLAIASTGNVSMGSTSSVYGRLLVDASTSGNEQNTALAVRGRDASASYIALNVLNNADGGLFSVRNDGLCTVAGGISFGDETLDTYDEGTFTATLTSATPPTTPPTATGTYVKIGKVVRFSIYYANVNTSGGSGIMQVTGLPFTSGAEISDMAAPSMYGFVFNGDAKLSIYVTAGSTIVNFLESYSNAGWTNLNITAGSAKYMQLSGTYITA